MELYDVITVGFGPAGLALAVQMNDTNHKSLFLEKQTDFQWHGGMLLEDATMRISYLKDMATLQDPKSHFTFLNYLKEHGRLTAFINLGTFYPFRTEFNDYLKWVASHFTDKCIYGSTVTSIEPVEMHGQVDIVKVISTDIRGKITERYCKNVVVAVGNQPRYLSQFLTEGNVISPRVLHSSEYLLKVKDVLPDKKASYKIVVVGAGQSAAEIFSHISEAYPNAQVSLTFREASLRCVDDSPFVNEIFDPEYVDYHYEMNADDQVNRNAGNGNTNYAVVDPPLLDELYRKLYKQKLVGTDRMKVLPAKAIGIATLSPTGKLSFSLSSLAGVDPTLEMEDVDAVILATGYHPTENRKILKSLDDFIVKKNDDYSVTRQYRVETKDQCTAGIYLQGCCEKTHGLSDTLLSLLPIRANEVLSDMLKNDYQRDLQRDLKILRTTSVDSGFSSPGPIEHFKRMKPTPGTVLFTKYSSDTKLTLEFRVADPEKDLDSFHDWMNQPRIDEFWKEAGSLEGHKSYLEKMVASEHSIPLIGFFDKEPFAYFEMYWAHHDKIGEYYGSQQYDRGLHFLVGNQKYRGPSRVNHWLPSLLQLALTDHPLTTRVVSEPRSDNAKMISYLSAYGMTRMGNVQLPHKEATIMMMSK